VFSKKTVTVIELSDESKQALSSLDSDMQILSGFMGEILENQRKILSQLSREITEELPTESSSDGVKVFSSEKPVEDRIRDMPFARRPRTEQVAWLLSIMKPGEWYNCADLAKQYGSDVREVRYFRSSIGGRFREMMEEGLLVRRQCNVRGALYEYGLSDKGKTAV
jgi:hypothetical protein